MTQHCSKISRTTTAKTSGPLDRYGPQKQIRNPSDIFKTEQPKIENCLRYNTSFLPPDEELSILHYIPKNAVLFSSPALQNSSLQVRKVLTTLKEKSLIQCQLLFSNQYLVCILFSLPNSRDLFSFHVKVLKGVRLLWHLLPLTQQEIETQHHKVSQNNGCIKKTKHANHTKQLKTDHRQQ